MAPVRMLPGTLVGPPDLLLCRRFSSGDLIVIVTLSLVLALPPSLPQATSLESLLKPPQGQATVLQGRPQISLFSEPTQLHPGNDAAG